jgi:hypothetical protein
MAGQVNQRLAVGYWLSAISHQLSSCGKSPPSQAPDPARWGRRFRLPAGPVGVFGGLGSQTLHGCVRSSSKPSETRISRAFTPVCPPPPLRPLLLPLTLFFSALPNIKIFASREDSSINAATEVPSALSAPSAFSGFDFCVSSAPLRLCGDSRGVSLCLCGDSRGVSLCLCADISRSRPCK